jgi:tripartite-type tricarboxylate transporter receptor subunit TctC
MAMQRYPVISHAALAALLVMAAAPAAVFAQDYPAKQVRIIVSLAPGGMSDIFARAAAQRLTEASKQPFIVENRTGAGGNIGAEFAARAPADGYTLYMGFHGTNAINPVLYGAKLGFDPFKDFIPVILVARVPNVLVVHPTLPVKSVKELVALGRANPKSLTYASQGIGSSGHMAGELFKITAKLDIVHVPYKGAAPAIADLIGGHVTIMFDIVSLALPHIRSGKMKALAVVGRERVPVLPELPTMAEVGLPAIEGGPWFGLFARTGTPRSIIEWLNREVAAAFKVPDVRDRYTAQGVVFDLGSPESFGAHVTAEHERWKNVIQKAGIRID